MTKKRLEIPVAFSIFIFLGIGKCISDGDFARRFHRRSNLVFRAGDCHVANACSSQNHFVTAIYPQTFSLAVVTSTSAVAVTAAISMTLAAAPTALTVGCADDGIIGCLAQILGNVGFTGLHFPL